MATTDDQRPYFFLSYARMRLNNGQHPDKWIIKFYQDLCNDIAYLTGCARPGYMDQQQLKIGTEWSDELTDALATCRVFLPVYSPTYFSSEYCGKEWAIFHRRLEDHAVDGTLPSAIIPAMWTQMDLGKLPAFAGTRQLGQADLPHHYLREGLYGIMKLGRFREAYKETVLGFAKTIIATAERVRLSDLVIGDKVHLSSIESAFTHVEQPSAGQDIRVTIAACDLNGLPAGRGPYYYGRVAREWNPYRTADEHLPPIARMAANIIDHMGHRAAIQELGAPSENATQMPDVMLVDAWATDSEKLEAELRAADESPAVVLVPSSEEDVETKAHRERLDEAVGNLLGQALARLGSGRWVPLESFRSAFIQAVNGAISHHLRTVPVEDPPPARARPRLTRHSPGG